MRNDALDAKLAPIDYQAAWNRLIDELIACHGRCGQYDRQEYRDIEVSIEAVLELIDTIENNA